MGFAKFHDDGRAPSWALHDLRKEGRAPGTPFEFNGRAPSWALHRRPCSWHTFRIELNGRAPSWALHNLGWDLNVFLVIVKLRGC